MDQSVGPFQKDGLDLTKFPGPVKVGPYFGLVRPGFVLQTRKLSIRASARTCANYFLLLIVKCPMPARKTLSLWRDKSLHSISLAYIPARCMFMGSWVPPTGVPSGEQGVGGFLEGLFLFLFPCFIGWPAKSTFPSQFH